MVGWLETWSNSNYHALLSPIISFHFLSALLLHSRGRDNNHPLSHSKARGPATAPLTFLLWGERANRCTTWAPTDGRMIRNDVEQPKTIDCAKHSNRNEIYHKVYFSEFRFCSLLLGLYVKHLALLHLSSNDWKRTKSQPMPLALCGQFAIKVTLNLPWI